jgi:hypothetical protein
MSCALQVSSVELFAGCQSVTSAMKRRGLTAVGLDIKAPPR